MNMNNKNSRWYDNYLKIIINKCCKCSKKNEANLFEGIMSAMDYNLQE